jgi:hypothetical protein
MDRRDHGTAFFASEDGLFLAGAMLLAVGDFGGHHLAAGAFRRMPSRGPAARFSLPPVDDTAAETFGARTLSSRLHVVTGDARAHPRRAPPGGANAEHRLQHQVVAGASFAATRSTSGARPANCAASAPYTDS